MFVSGYRVPEILTTEIMSEAEQHSQSIHAENQTLRHYCRQFEGLCTRLFLGQIVSNCVKKQCKFAPWILENNQFSTIPPQVGRGGSQS